MTFEIYKVIGGLPANLEPNAIYIVRIGTGFDLYVTDATGVNAHKVNGLSDLMAMFLQADAPPRPDPGQVVLYSRKRGGYSFFEMLREKGRPLAFQPHLGLNRVGSWQPTGGGISNIGLNSASMGTVSSPGSGSSSLASSALKARVTSAATTPQAAEYRASHTNLWRGNAPNLGGFLTILRFSLVTLVAGANGFFGLTSTGNVVNPMDLASWSGQFIGLGFKEGTHSNWQIARRGNTGGTVFTDLGPDWPITDTTAVITLYLYSEPNGDRIYVQVVNETTGLTVDHEFTDSIPIPSIFLAPRTHLDNGPTAAAVAFDLYGGYVESDY